MGGTETRHLLSAQREVSDGRGATTTTNDERLDESRLAHASRTDNRDVDDVCVVAKGCAAVHRLWCCHLLCTAQHTILWRAVAKRRPPCVTHSLNVLSQTVGKNERKEGKKKSGKEGFGIRKTHIQKQRKWREEENRGVYVRLP